MKSLIPSFNECVDQFLDKLKGAADGKTEVPMSTEFGMVTLNIIGKVVDLIEYSLKKMYRWLSHHSTILYIHEPFEFHSSKLKFKE